MHRDQPGTADVDGQFYRCAAGEAVICLQSNRRLTDISRFRRKQHGLPIGTQFSDAMSRVQHAPEHAIALQILRNGTEDDILVQIGVCLDRRQNLCSNRRLIRAPAIVCI